jgi:hypothetical protein
VQEERWRISVALGYAARHICPRLTFVGVVVPPEAKEKPAVLEHVIVAHVMYHLPEKGVGGGLSDAGKCVQG